MHDITFIILPPATVLVSNQGINLKLFFSFALMQSVTRCVDLRMLKARWPFVSGSSHYVVCWTGTFFAYLDFLYNPVLQGNWPHSLWLKLGVIRGERLLTLNGEVLLWSVKEFICCLYKVSCVEWYFVLCMIHVFRNLPAVRLSIFG
jgi:hypothetical protein